MGTALYPIGINFYGKVEYQRLPVVIDETTLKAISERTGGKYFRATSETVLKDIFSEIDKLEKTKMDVKKFSKRYDAFQPFVLAAFIAMLLEVLLRLVVFRRIP